VVYVPASWPELVVSVRRAAKIEGSRALVADGEMAVLDEGASEGRTEGRERERAEANEGKLPLLAAPDEPSAVGEEEDDLGGFGVLMGMFPDPGEPSSSFSCQ
jgi:hypothetical protein